MNIIGGGKNKKKEGKEAKVQTWKEKKKVADKEDDLRKDIENLKTWIDMMQTMDNQQVKEYLKNRLDGLEFKPCQKYQKSQKSKTKVQTNGKDKSSGCSGIMALVWKFHKD